MRSAVDRVKPQGFSPDLQEALKEAALFFDARQVGDIGALGFRRTTEISRILPCLDPLIRQGLLTPGKTRFLDMGCGDGRVNLLFGYLAEVSVGVELDDWILEEYTGLRDRFDNWMRQKGLPRPSGDIHLFCGDTLDPAVHDSITKCTGLGLRDFDLFYTYLTMQEEFAGLIAQEARPGAAFLIYGLESIQPRFPGLRLLTPGRSMNGVLAVYLKE